MASLGSFVSRWPPAVRYGFLIVVGVLLCWFAFAVSVDNVLGARRPDFALSYGAGSESTKVAVATKLLQPRATQEQIAQAQRLAEAAVRASPVNVGAIRVLGLVAALRNDNRTAERLFTYAEGLSRRDLPTQLWLIEHAVQRDDIAEALLHYDRALRTQVEARAILFPVLMAAASDPAIARPLARIMAARPDWWPVFAETMIASPRSSPRALAFLLQNVRLRPSEPTERPLLLAALARLVNDGEYRGAQRLYRSVRSPRAPQTVVTDGGFDAAPDLPPFDWLFVEDVDLSAFRDTREDGYVLRLQSAEARSGDVARQLLLLQPGSYRLSFTVGDVATDSSARPAIMLRCANSEAREIVRLDAPEAASGGRSVSRTFNVSGGDCSAQWLAIYIGPADSGQPVAPWVDGISIVPSTATVPARAGP